MKIIILIIVGTYCIQGAIACLRHNAKDIRDPIGILDFFRMTCWPYIWWNPSILERPGKRLRCVLGYHRYIMVSRDHTCKMPLLAGGEKLWEVHQCKYCGKELSGFIGDTFG